MGAQGVVKVAGQVRDFCAENSEEFVLLDFSHLYLSSHPDPAREAEIAAHIALADELESKW